MKNIIDTITERKINCKEYLIGLAKNYKSSESKEFFEGWLNGVLDIIVEKSFNFSELKKMDKAELAYLLHNA